MAGSPPPTPELDAVTFRDRAVYLPGDESLVLADLHLGRDRTSNVALPLGERADLLDRLGALLDRFSPERVIVAGDLLHAFDRLPDPVAGTLAALETRVADAGAALIVTRGNHDTMLGSLLGECRTEYTIGDTVVCHGHERPDATADLYVVGHEHPAITLEGRKRPCYLLGPATDGGRALVVPAFTRLAPGTDVAGRRSFRSPLLGPPGQYRPIVRDEAGDATLSFPPLRKLRSLL